MALLKELFSNNAVSLLAAPITSTDTSLQVLTGMGGLYPSPGPNEYFSITLEDQSATVREIIYVTGRSGDTLTFSLGDRGREGTTVQNWSASSGHDTLVDHRLTAGCIANKLSNDYANTSYPALHDYKTALDHLLSASPSVPSGSVLYNQEFTLTPGISNTIVQLNNAFRPNGTAVFVGGLRQKLGVDYAETGISEITLNFVLTQTMIDEGQSVTVDIVTP